MRTTKCPHCGYVQAGLGVRDGKLYAIDGDMCGPEIKSYVCPNCQLPVHWGVRKPKVDRQNAMG